MLSDRSSIYSRSSIGSTTTSRTSPRLTSISSGSSSHNHYKPASSSYHQQPYLTQSMLMAHCIASSGTPTITGYDLASSNKHSSSYRRNYNPSSHSSSSHRSSYSPTTANTTTTTTTTASRLDVGQHHHASNALRFVSSNNNLSAYESRYTPNLPPRGLLSSTRPPTTTSTTTTYNTYRPKLRERPLLSTISSTRTLDTSLQPDSRRTIPDSYRLSSYSNNNYRLPTTSNMTKKPTDNSVQGATNDDDQWSSDLTRNISRNKYIIKFREQEVKPSVEVSWDLDQAATQTKKPTSPDETTKSQVTATKLKEEQKPDHDHKQQLSMTKNSSEQEQKTIKKQSDIVLAPSQVTSPAGDSSKPEVKKDAKKNVRNLKIKVKNAQQSTKIQVSSQDSKEKSALSEINANTKTKELRTEPITNEKIAKKTAKKTATGDEKVKLAKTKVKSPTATKEIEPVENKFSSEKKCAQEDRQKDVTKNDDSASALENETKRIRFREYCFEDFDFVSVLGHGGWGFVFLAELKNHNSYFAVKCIKKLTILEDDDLESIMIERKVLTLGNIHPFICKLFCTFENEGYLFFVMEYCAGGDLMFHVQKEGKFSESRCRFYAAEIICAIRFLHNRHIIYRDLKLDNILLDASGHIRLVDFGMCQCRTYREELLPSNFCGTPEYISPEIIKGVPYNHSVDWWSFGVLLYEMAVGKMPFRGSDENELLWNVCYEKIHFPHFLSPELRSLLQLLLERDPVKRLGMTTCTAGDIYEQPWFEGINWTKIEQLKVEPPFVPQVKSPKDVQNFDPDFTDATPELSPVEESTIERIDQQLFHGFSYTNPNLFFC